MLCIPGAGKLTQIFASGENISETEAEAIRVSDPAEKKGTAKSRTAGKAAAKSSGNSIKEAAKTGEMQGESFSITLPPFSAVYYKIEQSAAKSYR